MKLICNSRPQTNRDPPTLYACFLLLLLSLGCVNVAIASQMMVKNIVLTLYKGQTIELPHPADSIFITNPQIAEFTKKSPTIVYVYGKQIGETALVALDKHGNAISNIAIFVKPDINGLKKSLNSIFPRLQLKIEEVANSILIKGSVNSAADAQDIKRLAFQYVGDESRILNFIRISSPMQVNIRVRIVEMSRQISRLIGVNWNSIYTTGSTILKIGTNLPNPEPDLATLTLGLKTGNFDLNAFVDLLDREKLVTILSQPNLTALAGETARFLAGGEFPILVPQGTDQVTVQYKPFGVSLAFTPTLIDQTMINLHVMPEVSEISTEAEININGFKFPSLNTRRAETTIELHSGQSFAIAGLLQSDAQHDIQKYPGLGDLPILGALFRSERYTRGETELVIIVTPYIVTPVDRNQLAVPAPDSPSLTKSLSKKNHSVGFILD